VPLIWLTGVPGAGKSTVRRELLRRGEIAYDADEDGLRVLLDRETGLPVEDPGRGNRPMNWHERHWYPIVRERVEDLRRDAEHGNVFLVGSVPNELDVWELFAVVICLVVDDETLLHRLETRTDNDFGKTAAVRDTVLGWNATSASTYERFGATLIDATQPLKNVVDEVLAAVAAPSV
jgi:dephospho-CoA kinase